MRQPARLRFVPAAAQRPADLQYLLRSVFVPADKWIVHNKDKGQLAAVASIGCTMLWDEEAAMMDFCKSQSCQSLKTRLLHFSRFSTVKIINKLRSDPAYSVLSSTIQWIILVSQVLG